MYARLLLAVALSGGLAGCAEDPEQPSTLPPLTAAPSVSPSAGTEPIPSGVDAPTPDGASAFARYWYTQIEQAFVTKNPELISRLSAPDCQACARYVSSVTGLRDRNERVDPFEYMIISAEAPGIELGAETVNVTVLFNTDKTVFYNAQDEVILTEAALVDAEETLVLVRQDGAWSVQKVVAG
jgi:hypothetical protein